MRNTLKNPCSPYGIAKLSVEKYLFYYKEVYGIDYVAMRYANVYGPRQNAKGEAGVVAIFTTRMLNGEQPVINGDGGNTRDYVFVNDVVEANIVALNDNASGAYNVGTAIETDVNEIFRKLKKLTNSECDEIHGPAKEGEQRRSVISWSKLSKEHNWRPTVNMDEGLRLTVDSFRKKFTF
jgi:UDP-glucose 4-epimerase